jgi:5-methyltetrahydrofolate--homocysteine methyltransferase
MAPLLAVLQSGRVLLMDGAMGSELYQAGLDPDECGEAWNLARPERVRAVHAAYVAAGARCLLTNTFQANPCALVRHDREEDLERIVIAGVRLARAAAGRDGFVLGDIGPVLISETDQEFSDWSDLRRVVEAFLDPAAEKAGVDGLLLETCSTPRALSAVAFIRRRVLDNDEVPILLSLAYLRGPNGALVTHSGHVPETFARHAARHGVTALGVNCGREIDLNDIIEVIKRYRQATELPLFARPNAGTPRTEARNLVYPRTPEEMAERLPELLEAGVAMVGGCCGTTPAHIAAFRSLIEKYNGPRRLEG